MDTRVRWREPRFAIATAVALLLTHAIAYFLHEYSHATMAWVLGLKANPLAIYYGHLDLSNVLLQQEIYEHVDYTRIFAEGHDRAAAAIALAGPGIGNGVLYIVLALLLRARIGAMRPAVALFLFWLALMAAANLWSYAPIRTIATHADMALAGRGLGISQWTLFPFVVLPALGAAWHFFARLRPLVLAHVCDDAPLRPAFISAIAVFIFFGFYGVPGIAGDYGNVSAVFSILSIFLVLPVVTMLTLTPIFTPAAVA